MRVLHVIDALGVGGGAEHSLAAMLPLLRDRGVENSVACLYPREGGLQERLRQQGFSLHVLNGGFTLSGVWELRRLIKETRPDVVHATLIKASLLTRLACLGTPVVQVNSIVNTTYDPSRIRSLHLKPWKVGLLRLIDRLSARTVRGGFHALTEVVKDEAVRALKIAERRVTVIPRGRSAHALGVCKPPRRALIRSALRVAEDELLVLNVGRLDAQKGQATLVEAFDLVAQQLPHAKLLIAGRPGDASEAVGAALERARARERIVLLGHREDVPELLCGADLFVFPSIYEGLGGALLEAMALGCPIVGSDAPAIVEVLDQGRCGRIVHRGDVAALAGAMIDVLQRPDERRRLAGAARVRFEATYENERVVDATLEMYRRVLEREGRGRASSVGRS